MNGRLLKVSERDGRSSGYDLPAVYGPLAGPRALSISEPPQRSSAWASLNLTALRVHPYMIDWLSDFAREATPDTVPAAYSIFLGNTRYQQANQWFEWYIAGNSERYEFSAPTMTR